jgi:hypothetical protein
MKVQVYSKFSNNKIWKKSEISNLYKEWNI